METSLNSTSPSKSSGCLPEASFLLSPLSGYEYPSTWSAAFNLNQQLDGLDTIMPWPATLTQAFLEGSPWSLRTTDVLRSYHYEPGCELGSFALQD